MAVNSIAHALIADYIPFIIFVGSLYTVAGGIHIRSSFIGRPAVNTAFMALGAVCANIMGTTGAAMLLIRPLIAANAHRRYDMHTFVFFIFIVANIAGSLTPLGDPPLFLGFLRGVEFFWTTEHLIVPMLTAVGLLLLIYFIADTILFNKEKEEFLEKGFSKSSLRTIAAKADTTTGTIYSRFGGKEGLFSAIVEPVSDRIIKMFLETQESFMR